MAKVHNDTIGKLEMLRSVKGRIATLNSRIAALEAENGELKEKLTACEEERDTRATDDHDRMEDLRMEIDGLRTKLIALSVPYDGD
jgi:chromosome segregation ATPase